MSDRVPLILDVDTGIDDSLALLYAAASAEANLVAVTCVSGNVEARQVATNTLAVLELAGRTDIEVAIGREVPLVRPLETTPETHGPDGIGHARLPPPSRPVSDRHGVDVIVEEARRLTGEVTLVTLGPLTNVAVALEREPALPRLLRGLVSMGGAFGVPGNTTPTISLGPKRCPCKTPIENVVIGTRLMNSTPFAEPNAPMPAFQASTARTPATSDR